MRKFLIALSFFTRIPIQIKSVTDDEFYDAMILMPVIGVVIGFFLYSITYLNKLIQQNELTAILLLIFYVWITGGLHFDGFADTIDAIFSSRDHEKMMIIMKDSRLGAFGAIGLILIFLALWVGYKEILELHKTLFLIVLPVVGRYCSLQSCCFLPYADGGGGLGKRIVEKTKIFHLCIYLFFIIPATYLSLGKLGILAVLSTMACNFLIMIYLKYKIGGMTGDTIGMTIELTQCIYLLLLIILHNFTL